MHKRCVLLLLLVFFISFRSIIILAENAVYVHPHVYLTDKELVRPKKYVPDNIPNEHSIELLIDVEIHRYDSVNEPEKVLYIPDKPDAYGNVTLHQYDSQKPILYKADNTHDNDTTTYEGEALTTHIEATK